MTVKELYRALDARFPKTLSCDWDNDGLQCCPCADTELSGSPVLLTLDVTAEAVDEAERIGARMILSHHPLLFRPLKELRDDSPKGSLLLRLVRAGIAVASFHTRLDAAEEGVGICLAKALSLSEILPFDVEGFPMGRIGALPEKLRGTDAKTLAAFLKERLQSGEVSFANAGRPISRLAVLGGSGGDGVSAAIALGADGFVTGDISYNAMLDAVESGLSVFRCGHFETEQPALAALDAAVKAADPNLSTRIFSDRKIRTL